MHRLKLKRYNSGKIRRYSKEYGVIPAELSRLSNEIEASQARLEELLPQQRAYNESNIEPIEAQIKMLNLRKQQVDAPKLMNEHNKKIGEITADIERLKSNLRAEKQKSKPIHQKIESIQSALNSSDSSKIDELKKQLAEAENKKQNAYNFLLRSQSDPGMSSWELKYRVEYEDAASKVKDLHAELNQEMQKSGLDVSKIPPGLPKNEAGLRKVLQQEQAKVKNYQEKENDIAKQLSTKEDQLAAEESQIRNLEGIVNDSSPNEYSSINDSSRLDELLNIEKEKLLRVKNANSSVDGEINECKERIERNNREIARLKSKQASFQENDFLDGYIFKPAQFLEGMKKQVAALIYEYNANYPHGQHKMTRTCLIDMEVQMQAILNQGNRREGESLALSRKQILQMSGMLWNAYNAVLFTDIKLRDKLASILGTDVYEPDEAIKEYKEFIKTHPDVKPLTYAELDEVEASIFSANLVRLNDVINSIDSSQSGLKALAKCANKVKNAVVNTKSTSKYNSLLLESVTSFLLQPGNPTVLAKLQKLYETNPDHRWFSGVKSALGGFISDAQKIQPAFQHQNQGGLFARTARNDASEPNRRPNGLNTRRMQ